MIVGVYLPGHRVERSSLEIVERLLKLGRSDYLIKDLLLSAQSVAFGAVEAYLFPKRRNLSFVVLLVVAALGGVIAGNMFLK